MKAGRSLQEVLMELEHQNKAKKDYIAPAQGMKLERDGRTFLMGTQTPFATIPLFHRQLASALSIPMKYYDLMQKEKPELLAENVNARPQPRIHVLRQKFRLFFLHQVIIFHRYR